MHPAFSGIGTLLLFLIVIGAIGLGLMIALIIFVFSRRNRETPSQITVSNQGPPSQEDMSQIMKRIDDYHREDTKRSYRWHYQMLGFVLLGFGLAVANLAVAQVSPLATIISAIEAAIFITVGIFLSTYYSNKFK